MILRSRNPSTPNIGSLRTGGSLARRSRPRSVAFILVAVAASFSFAGSPIPGTFHIVCGAAQKDGVLSALVGAPMVFEADAGGAAGYMFTWHFSDGSIDSGRQVTHAFLTGGRQSASLTVHLGSVGSAGSTLAIQVVGLGNEPNAIVIAGAGFVGDWDTEIVLGNPSGSELALALFTKRLSSDYTGCQLSTCPPPEPAFITLGPNAQRTVRYSELFPPGITGVYVSSASDVLPSVRARAYATSQPARAMELPIVTYETLVSRPPTTLAFVGASKSSASHSNLFLAETANLADSGATVRIEAVDAAGSVVGALDQAIPAGGAVLLSDVLASMGIAQFDGQIDVSQTGGTGVVSGALATLADDGGFSVSSGFVP